MTSPRSAVIFVEKAAAACAAPALKYFCSILHHNLAFTQNLGLTHEQIHYLGQYLSTKSIYGEFLKAPNKKIFRQAHSDELAQYEEALQILKQHSPDGKFPTMKDLRAEKEQLTIQKDTQYDTYHYFKDYHKELQTVCANVDSILGTEQEVQQHEQQRTRKYEPSL